MIKKLSHAILIFLAVIKNKNMIIKKIFGLILITICSLTILGSCSSSKKLEKKCRDCPEFSYYDENI